METKRITPQFDETRCTLCGLCVEICRCNAVELGEQRPIFACKQSCQRTCADALDCWCLCEEVCPTGAISCSFEIVSASAI
jgi:formate hydrogenlyase subunit 6/NADH:ubiquinone oxidoreductase subunit I